MATPDMSPVGAYFLIVCACTLWVAFDARRFDWHGNQLCDRAWKWVVGCLFLSGIAVPAYLWQRRNAPAQRSPGFATGTPAFFSPAVGTSTSGAAAIERAAAELVAAGPGRWEPEIGTRAYTPAAKPPLLVSPAASTAAGEAAEGSLALALLAGAAAALAGGLLWAGVVIVTRWDIGIVAWVVGAATGGTVLRVFGGPVPGSAKLAAGMLAAGAVVVGKYVIFVHDVKKNLGALLAQHGLSVGYLDTRQMSIFVHNFGSFVRPIYGLWILLAFAAAVRTAQGSALPARR